MRQSLPPILLLGFGKMGGALAAGWTEQGLDPSFAIDPVAGGSGAVTCIADAAALPPEFSPRAVVLAVKPQVAAASVPALTRFAGGAVFLSIMAGQTIATLTSMLGAGTAVVRAMPNTPASIRQGMSVACAGAAVTETQLALCDRLLGAVGDVAWTEHEAQLDAVTAISGGGPAYLFLLTELLEQAGIEQGLPPPLARTLARRTVSGSGALLASSNTDAADLRRAVTSPNGTTERALAVLMADWPDSVSRAIAAATRRSRELAI